MANCKQQVLFNHKVTVIAMRYAMSQSLVKIREIEISWGHVMARQ